MSATTVTLTSTNNSTTSPTTGSTTYYTLGVGRLNGSTTESSARVPWREAGTLSRLTLRITSNGTTSGTTVTGRYNAVNQAPSISIGAGVTGLLQDLVGTMTVGGSGTSSYVNVQAVIGATGTTAFSFINMDFTPTADKSTEVFINTQSVNLSTASATNYWSLCGRTQPSSAEVTQSQMVRLGGTARSLFITISANARTTTTTFTLRKNTANATNTIAVTTATGTIEDVTPHNDTISANDLLAYSFVTGTGTQIITFENIGIWFDPTSRSDFHFGGGTGTVLSLTSTSTAVWGKAGGDMNSTSDSAQVNAQMPEHSCTFKNLRVYVNSNSRTVGDTTTVTLQNNGVNTALQCAFGSGVTAIIEDTTHTAFFREGDLSSLEFKTGSGTGTISFTTYSFVKTLASLNIVNAIRWSAMCRASIF